MEPAGAADASKVSSPTFEDSPTPHEAKCWQRKRIFALPLFEERDPMKFTLMRQGLKCLARPTGERAQRPRRGLLLSLVLLAAAVVTAVFAPAAAADKPVKDQFASTNTATITGVCSFDINLDASVRGTYEDFFDKSGAIIREHDNIVEQDTFSANGKSLTGDPFTFNLEFIVDSSGDLTHVYATGVVEKVRLPDGSLFISAGWLDFAAHGFPDFILTPDHGAAVNLAGFCAALSP